MRVQEMRELGIRILQLRFQRGLGDAVEER